MPVTADELARVIRDEFDRHESGCENLLKQVGERLEALDDRLKSFDKIVITGNGQPSMLSQLINMRADLNNLTKDVAENTEARDKLAPALAAQLVTLQNKVDGMEKDFTDDRTAAKNRNEKKETTRFQLVLAWLGIIGALAASLAGPVYERVRPTESAHPHAISAPDIVPIK